MSSRKNTDPFQVMTSNRLCNKWGNWRINTCDMKSGRPKSSSPFLLFHRPSPAMEIVWFRTVSLYLCRSELARCCLLNKDTFGEFSGDVVALRWEKGSPHQKLLASKRCVAASRASRWWRACVQRRWLNQVAWEAARMHAFPHRTETNFLPWRRHFCGGIAGIDRIHATTRYVPSSDAAVVCPHCDDAPVCVALWRQVGEKMVRSTPHLDIGCGSCMTSRSFQGHDVGWVTVFSLSRGVRNLTWRRCDAYYDE